MTVSVILALVRVSRVYVLTTLNSMGSSMLILHGAGGRPAGTAAACAATAGAAAGAAAAAAGALAARCCFCSRLAATRSNLRLTVGSAGAAGKIGI